MYFHLIREKNLRTLVRRFFVMLYFELHPGSHVDQELRMHVVSAAASMFSILAEEHIEPLEITHETSVSVQFYKGYVPRSGSNRGPDWLGSAARTSDGVKICLSMKHESAEDFLRTLAHELIHLHQILRGDLPYYMSREDSEEEADTFMDQLVSLFQVRYPSIYQDIKTRIGLCLS